MLSQVWDEITYPFQNFNSATVEVWEWIRNFTPQFLMDVLIYPCRDSFQVNKRSPIWQNGWAGLSNICMCLTHWPLRGGQIILKVQFSCKILEFFKWVSEWLNLTAFLGTADSEVHIVHSSRVIVAYTLESLSSIIVITRNLQATINFKRKDIKNDTQKMRAPIKLTCHWRLQLYISLQWH